MATIINAPVKAHGDVTYPKLRVVLDSLQFTLDSIITGVITANRAVVTDASSLLSTSTTTATEIGYVSGVTSSIQTQLAAKATKALDNLASTAVNADIIPASNGASSLGSSSLRWSNIYSQTLTGTTLNTGSATNLSIQRNANEKINVAQTGGTLSGSWTLATDGETSTQAKLSINAPTSNNGQLILQAVDNGGQRNVTITNAAVSAGRTWTLPELSTNPTFMALEAAQTVSGVKTFSAANVVTGSMTINDGGLILKDSSGTHLATIKASVSADRTYTMPDTGGAAIFVMTEGTTTINGAKTFSALLTPSAGVKGISTNTAATAGNVGEYVSSYQTFTAFPTSGQYGDLTSISLTAGDWDVTATLYTNVNGGTITQYYVGISTTTGNSATGLTIGDTLDLFFPGTAASDSSGAVVPFRLSLTTTTTVYLKYRANYSIATPNGAGRISARRVQPGT